MFSEENPNQQKKETAARIAVCVEELRGNRTMRQLSIDTGVATSYISSILKGENIPSIEVMKKLTDPDSKPQNGVGIEDLLAAAGLIRENASYIFDEEIDDETKENIPDKEIYDKVHEEIANDRDRRSEQMRMLVCGRLLASGVVVQFKEIRTPRQPFSVAGKKMPSEPREERKGNINFTLQVQNVEAVDEWTFYSLPTGSDKRWISPYFSYFARFILPKIICAEPDRKRCTTLIFDDKYQYEKLLNRYKGKLCYRGNLSIVLVNVETYEFEKEAFLTLYDEDVDEEKMSLMALGY